MALLTDLDQDDAWDVERMADSPCLLRLTEAVSRAIQRLAEGPVRARCPRQRCARLVTSWAAVVFQVLTGSEPTIRVHPDTSRAYGPMLEFLEELFRIFGIKASAEHYMKEYRARSRAQKPPPHRSCRRGRG
jgi:hypothetical protein